MAPVFGEVLSTQSVRVNLKNLQSEKDLIIILYFSTNSENECKKFLSISCTILNTFDIFGSSKTGLLNK